MKSVISHQSLEAPDWAVLRCSPAHDAKRAKIMQVCKQAEEMVRNGAMLSEDIVAAMGEGLKGLGRKK